MDKQLIEEKLESLRRSILRVEEKYRVSKDVLQADYDAQDVIALNLTRAVQLCVDIATHIISQTEILPPATMAEVFVKLVEINLISSELSNKMISAVGFRNVAVPSYDQINWDIVKSICEYNLQDFKQFAKAMDTRLNN